MPDRVDKCRIVACRGTQGIYDTLKECAAISKSAGGIGLSIHNIRGTGSYIRGTNGNSNGIVPMLRVFNDTARYVDQVPHPAAVIMQSDSIMASIMTSSD